MAEEAVEAISKVRKVSRSVESFQKILERHAPDRGAFETLMQRKEPGTVEPIAKETKPIEAAGKPTLMDEVARLNSKVEGLSKASAEDLVAQADVARKQIAQIQEQLNQPGVQVRDSVQSILKTKLTNIQENLQVALNKAGVEGIPAAPAVPGANPIARFLDLLSNGQYNLERLGTTVQEVANRGEHGINAADMLVLQLKVHNIQSELEFFTSLLNKSLESTKTLMNVQV